jgi:hypothetical protein
MRRVRLALVGLLVAAFSLGLEVARWRRGSYTANDVLGWAIVLIPLVLACVIATNGR